MMGPDGAPTVPGKGRIWKAAYHDGRALLNVGDRLRTLARSMPDPVGIFDGHGDIGPVKIPGSAVYDEAAEAYAVRASGSNMWSGKDEFHFAWKRITGDFILQAKVEFLGKGVEPHRKLGLIVRSSLDPGSPHVNVSRHGDGLTALQFRRAAGAETEETRSGVNGADVLQLERKGDTYTMSVARFGDVYATEQLTGVQLGDDVYQASTSAPTTRTSPRRRSCATCE